MKVRRVKNDGAALNSKLIRRPIQRWFWLFLLPTFASFCIGFVYPFLKGLFLSFCKFKTTSKWTWIGLKNYGTIFRDASFLHAFWYTALFAVVSLVIINVLAFAVAYCLTKGIKGSNLFRTVFFMGILEEVKKAFAEKGVDLACLEEIEDAALGNGGLGRLAACFLDSAATCSLPLTGYGLRYRFGLFKQTFEHDSQRETADDWTKYGDPWSHRRDKLAVKVKFADQTVVAVPYDMKAKWENEKNAIGRVQQLREKIETLNREIETAEQNYELEKAAKLKYGDLPEAKKQLEQEEKLAQNAKDGSLLRNKVTEEEIARIIERWTGIPVSKLMA